MHRVHIVAYTGLHIRYNRAHYRQEFRFTVVIASIREIARCDAETADSGISRRLADPLVRKSRNALGRTCRRLDAPAVASAEVAQRVTRRPARTMRANRYADSIAISMAD
jgi:hypothetical protein